MKYKNTRIESKNNNAEYIKKLISQGEHQRLDFKFSINDSRKIARTLVAFANTDGGRLLIGVKDNGTIAGVRSEEEFYMVQAAATMYTIPQVDFEANEFNIDNKKVVEIIVKKNENNNILYSAIEEDNINKIYIRYKDCNYLVNSIWLKAYKYKSANEGINIKIQENETKVLNLLMSNEELSFYKINKSIKLNYKILENILAKFIAIDIIEIFFSQNGIRYSLNKNMYDILK